MPAWMVSSGVMFPLMGAIEELLLCSCPLACCHRPAGCVLASLLIYIGAPCTYVHFMSILAMVSPMIAPFELFLLPDVLSPLFNCLSGCFAATESFLTDTWLPLVSSLTHTLPPMSRQSRGIHCCRDHDVSHGGCFAAKLAHLSSCGCFAAIVCGSPCHLCFAIYKHSLVQMFTKQNIESFS